MMGRAILIIGSLFAINELISGRNHLTSTDRKSKSPFRGAFEMLMSYRSDQLPTEKTAFP
jgi:hypothetical protein